jgi:hypothetical protein
MRTQESELYARRATGAKQGAAPLLSASCESRCGVALAIGSASKEQPGQPRGCEDARVLEPPEVIDGARVLKVADLAEVTPTGNTRHLVGGELQTTFAALAIAVHPDDRSYYLLYCDADWNAVTDTFHLDLHSALRQAEFEFEGVSFRDV